MAIMFYLGTTPTKIGFNVVAGFSAYLAAAGAGYLLWIGNEYGRPWSIGIQALQVLKVTSVPFIFHWRLQPEIVIAWVDPIVLFNFGLQPKHGVGFDQGGMPLSFAVSLSALACLIVLIRHRPSAEAKLPQ